MPLPNSEQRNRRRDRIEAIIAKALDDADRSIALVERQARDERRTRIAELEAQRDSVRTSARDVENSCLRAVEALAIATQRLASASAHGPDVRLPSWPEAVPQPIEIRMEEIRELTLRMSGPRGASPGPRDPYPHRPRRGPDARGLSR